MSKQSPRKKTAQRRREALEAIFERLSKLERELAVLQLAVLRGQEAKRV